MYFWNVRNIALSLVIGAATLGLLVSDAWAEGEAGSIRRWELGGFFGFQTFADGNRLSVPDDVTTSGLSLPKERSPFWGARLSYSPIALVALEIEAGQAPTSFSDTQVDVSTLLYRLQVVVHLKNPGPGIRPFLIAGVGGMRGTPSEALVTLQEEGEQLTLDTLTETDLETHLGLGLKYQLREAIGVRADLRLRWPSSSAENDTRELEGVVGVYVRI